MTGSLDFGYPWWLSYGHLVVLIPAALLAALAYARGWRPWAVLVLAGVALWAGAAFLVMRFVIDINGRPELPTQQFLKAGKGRVLDIGAGTGRSSIMVLQARPEATMVATDLFGDSFEHHFGKTESPQQMLQRNLKAAGVDSRASIETADMRKLPFDEGSFDAAVSAYAMDHLNRKGSDQALGEVARVLKPNGEFLLILVENDGWVKFAFGPALSHGGTRGRDWWTTHVQQAGFDLVEAGNRPLTLYVLARKK